MKDIKKRRGRIIFDRDLLTDKPTDEFLKTIFSNFYPIAINVFHDVSLYAKLEMFGYSMLFRELVEGEQIPLYEMTIHWKQTLETKDGIYIIEITEIS